MMAFELIFGNKHNIFIEHGQRPTFSAGSNRRRRCCVRQRSVTVTLTGEASRKRAGRQSRVNARSQHLLLSLPTCTTTILPALTRLVQFFAVSPAGSPPSPAFLGRKRSLADFCPASVPRTPSFRFSFFAFLTVCFPLLPSPRLAIPSSSNEFAPQESAECYLW